MDKKIFIGVDVGKDKNSINIIDINGQSLTKKGFEIENDYYGFINLKQQIDVLSYDIGFTYDECMVGVESTGHYWFNLRDYLKDIGIETVMVKTDSVRHRRALEEGQKGKNDTLDARVIASCIRNGNYVYIREHEREMRSLQKLTRIRESSTNELSALKNKIHRCIDVCNPVYFKIFENLNVKTGIGIIRYFPSPQDIINVEMEDIIKKVKNVTDKPNIRMIQLYKEECQICCQYVKEPSYAEKVEMLTYLERYLIEKKYRESLEIDIKKIAKDIIPLYDEFEKIKGIPIIQVISIISEIGDIRNFKNSRTILAFLGLSLRGNSSGKYIGERRINKAGSSLVRKHIFNIVDCLIRHNEYFRIAYCYYKSYNRKNPTKKREMQIALMCKYVRVMYGMLKHNSSISYREMLKRYDFSCCDMKVFKKEFEGETKSKKIQQYESAYNIYVTYSK